MDQIIGIFDQFLIQLGYVLFRLPFLEHVFDAGF